MCLVNLKEINPWEGWLKFIKSVRSRRKMWRKSDDFQKGISSKLLIALSSNLVCKVVYMKDIHYIEIGPVVIEIWGVKNGDIAVLNLCAVCLSWLLTHNRMSCCDCKDTLIQYPETYSSLKQKYCQTLYLAVCSENTVGGILNWCFWLLYRINPCLHIQRWRMVYI